MDVFEMMVYFSINPVKKNKKTNKQNKNKKPGAPQPKLIFTLQLSRSDCEFSPLAATHFLVNR